MTRRTSRKRTSRSRTSLRRNSATLHTGWIPQPTPPGAKAPYAWAPTRYEGTPDEIVAQYNADSYNPLPKFEVDKAEHRVLLYPDLSYVGRVHGELYKGVMRKYGNRVYKGLRRNSKAPAVARALDRAEDALDRAVRDAEERGVDPEGDWVCTQRRRDVMAAKLLHGEHHRVEGLHHNSAGVDIGTWMRIFAGIITQYDVQQVARETKRGGYGNIYRLGHLLKALHNIEEAKPSTAAQIRTAIDREFTEGNPGDKLRKIVDAYLEHGTLPKYPVSKVARGPAQRELPLRGNGVFDACAYCKSPPGRHRWWCKKLAKNGERLSVEDREAEQRGYNQLMTFANDAYNKAYKALDKDDYASAVKWFRAAAKYHTEAAIAAAPRHKEEHRNLAGSCKREAEIYSLPPDGMWRARGYR